MAASETGSHEDVLEVTEAARRQLIQVRDAEALTDVAVRVKVHEEGASFRYEFGFVRESSQDHSDAVVEADGVQIYIDPESLDRLRGARLEFVDDLNGRGFRFDNPNRPRLLDDPLAARVQSLIDQRINPMVASHGGRVTLVDVEEGRVLLRFGGGCHGCGMVDVTLKQGVEALLREEITEVTEIVDVTDHASGENPYYRSEP